MWSEIYRILANELIERTWRKSLSTFMMRRWALPHAKRTGRDNEHTSALSQKSEREGASSLFSLRHSHKPNYISPSSSHTFCWNRQLRRRQQSWVMNAMSSTTSERTAATPSFTIHPLWGKFVGESKTFIPREKINGPLSYYQSMWIKKCFYGQEQRTTTY